MRPHRVIHIQYTIANPYQKLLIDSLTNLGLEVKGLRFNQFPIKTLGISILSNIRKWRPDIIHFHWLHPFLLIGNSRIKTVVKSISFILQLLILKTMNIKIVWTAHNIVNHEKKYQNLEKFFVGILARFFNAIIIHCESAKSDIMKELKLRKDNYIFVIPHGNFLTCYDNTVSKKDGRNKLMISNEDLAFLFIGEVRPYKGIFELIESFKKLNHSYGDGIQLIISGRPKDNRIAEQVKEKSRGLRNIKIFLDFIPDEEIQKFVNAADVMVFPYRQIFTSGGIVLAMSFGKPIIAPRLGCIPETLDDPGSFLYDPKDPHGLRHAMKKAIRRKDKLLQMGIHNRVLAQKLSWEDIANSTYTVYRSCYGNNLEAGDLSK